MSIFSLVKKLIARINDPNRNLYERLFVLMTIISDIAVSIALIADLITGENIYEIILLTATIIIVPIITFTCLYKDRIQVAIRLIIISLVFVVLPGIFFFGGGVEGGAALWIIFAFLYVGLVISGVWRIVMMTLLFILALVCYLVDYFHPELIHGHSRSMFYVDSFLSLILVSLVCFVMVMFQNRVFKQENRRAKKAAERAEELNRSQNRFFSSMSHEIRTPINSILGLNELILREENISDEVARDAVGIQGAGKMLLALINDILDFSKMEAGSMDIVPVEYKVGDLMSEIVNMIWLRAQEKGLELNVSVDPNVPSVLYGDEVRIKQILINILNNAVKYTKEGSVGLHIESEEAGENTVMLRISVSDTGMGIKKDSMPYLFDAFKRVDEEKNRHIEGTGLGLSIVKQLVELMDGTISVNSVYGEGSTFNVILKQGVSDAEAIGELSIQNYGLVRKHAYESRFTAPDASVLIVDDNEMNLEVERKLLLATRMRVDTALSGKKALEETIKTHYDVILMDHLMPEMDGIDCLKEIRSQVGGLNQMTPIVVLTANAGSENKELYNHSGFDGYLIKPVSGEALEDMLLNHIPNDKLNIKNRTERMAGNTNATAGYSRKIPVAITTSSMCDLPDAVMRDPRLPILPFVIQTEDGIFKDGVQIGADELVRYIKGGKKALSAPPSTSVYTDFFANTLKTAHHVIYISLTTSMSDDYDRAVEASKAFDNVTIINSECLSSAMGLLVLIACKLAQRDVPVEEMIQELEMVKKRLKCSFIIENTDFMLKNGRISKSMHRFAESLSLRPWLRFKDDQSGVGGIFIGSKWSVYKSYIKRAFPVDQIPDSDVLFITYVDIDYETLLRIKKEVSKIAYFENIVFQQASAAISSNCGPGSFGLLYFIKSNKSYNVSSLIPTDMSIEVNNDVEGQIADENAAEDEDILTDNDNEKEIAAEDETSKPLWYESIEGIDGKIAIQNSGSEDAFKTVLKIFYDSIEEKEEELKTAYESEDWENYTIKIHALKSSCKLIGAMKLSEEALALEMAGKEGNTEYIRDNYDGFMEKYHEYKEILGKLYEGEEKADENEPAKPLADSFLMESVYEAIAAAAEDMDSDGIDEALSELSEYDVQGDDKEKIENIKKLAAKYDYEGITQLLGSL
ncbi:DegV family protein [Butyrivibrio sp. AE3004]|uniref:DegV family protein n=1 Tax=Butyrivibrio sp. AE3004 TaxID=1506994 RepID=UPI00068B39EF|nr:DegV family protein [Butyrivibrio sp. AE3004]